MSNVVAARNTGYENRNIGLENVRIGFRNFAGKEDQYNRAGDRNFAIFLEPEHAQRLLSAGMNVKELKKRDGDDPQEPAQQYIQVAVNYKGRPPRVVLITSRGQTQLGEDMVDMLDYSEIANVDLILNPYSWSVNGKSGVKAYLSSIYVTIQEDFLSLKYADVPEIERGNSQKAIESSPHSGFEDLGEVFDEEKPF